MLPTWQLTPTEIKTLTLYKPLYQRWGYRTGKNQSHQRFEKDSHDCCRLLQEYSDLVFRHLQQVNQWQETQLPEYDVLKKVQVAQEVDWADYPEVAAASTALLLNYFSDEATLNLFIDLTQQDLWDEAHSAAYSLIVVAARAIMCLAAAEYSGAVQHLQSFMDQYQGLSSISLYQDEMPERNHIPTSNDWMDD